MREPENGSGRAYRSVLHLVVHDRIDQMQITYQEAARRAGISPTTLRHLGDPSKRDSDLVLRKLTRLGFTLGELEAARAADDAVRTGAGPWPPVVYQLAALAMRMGPEDQARLLLIAEAWLN